MCNLYSNWCGELNQDSNVSGDCFKTPSVHLHGASPVPIISFVTLQGRKGWKPTFRYTLPKLAKNVNSRYDASSKLDINMHRCCDGVRR